MGFRRIRNPKRHRLSRLNPKKGIEGGFCIIGRIFFPVKLIFYAEKVAKIPAFLVENFFIHILGATVMAGRGIMEAIFTTMNVGTAKGTSLPKANGVRKIRIFLTFITHTVSITYNYEFVKFGR